MEFRFVIVPIGLIEIHPQYFEIEMTEEQRQLPRRITGAIRRTTDLKPS